MNVIELIQEANEISALQQTDGTSRLQWELAKATADLESINKRLTDRMVCLSNDLLKNVSHLAEGRPAPSLGIVQNSSNEIDRLCSLQDQAIEKVQLLLSLIDETEPL